MDPNNNSKPSRPPKKSGGQNRRGQGNASRGSKPKSSPITTNLSTSRGQAVRAQRRSQQDAQRIANQHLSAENKPAPERGRANVIDDSPRLKMIGLGGMDSGGSKNMILVEYQNDAV